MTEVHKRKNTVQTEGKRDVTEMSDGVDICEVLQHLRAGMNTIMTMAGISLCAALIFVLLTRHQVTETRSLELPQLPAWVWLQCQGDMRCRTDVLSSWLTPRAPDGVKVSVTPSAIVLTMRGSRDAQTERSALINGYLSELQQDWDVWSRGWQQAADSTCSEVRKESELCAGVTLLTRSQTRPLITVTLVRQDLRWPPGMAVTLSVLAGLLAGVTRVLLKAGWQEASYRRRRRLPAAEGQGTDE